MSVSQPAIASVVIPAHNEEAVVLRCLGTLLRDARPGELQVVVVANGCTDRTADLVRASGLPVDVIETEVGSKPLALNRGDAAVDAFPRFYLDADVEMNIDAVRKIVARLGRGDVQAAGPHMVFEMSRRPWSVRAYYDVWQRLPHATTGRLGGAYAVSRTGRARFDEFPSVTADDLFVQDLFAPNERAEVDGAEFVVHAPYSLRGLIRIKARGSASRHDYRRRFPDNVARAKELTGRRIAERARIVWSGPRSWPEVAVYSFVDAISEARGWWKFRTGAAARWDRDDSRAATAPD
jgi:glycosyltransferase involved in cell wall biosynthesis